MIEIDFFQNICQALKFPASKHFVIITMELRKKQNKKQTEKVLSN